MVAKSTVYTKIYRVLTIVLGFVLSANLSFAQSTSVSSSPTLTTNKKFSLNLRGEIGDRGFGNDSGERAQQIRTALGAKAEYKLNPFLSSNVNLIFVGVSSQAVSRFGDNVSSSGLYIGEAIVSFKPLEFLTLRAGALNQGYLQSPLLISDANSFPGAKEELEFKVNQNTLNFSFEQTIPTSTMLSTRTVDREVIPSFYAESVSLKSKMIKSFEFEVFGTLYQFRDLPSQVAFESSVYGNTIELLGPATSAFMFDFSGWVAGGQTTFEIQKIMNLYFGGHLLENMEAPLAYNQGQLAYVGAEIFVSKDFSVKPEIQSFFNESDTSPAFYNNGTYGHNNRKGVAGDVSLNFKNPDFVIKTQYAEADPISFNLNQTKQQFFMIRLETNYDVL